MLFEPERIVFNQLFFSYKGISFVIHLIIFVIFTFGVFYKAIQQDKLVYNKKQIQLSGLFLLLSVCYCAGYYFMCTSMLVFGLKVKLFLWCFYFVVLKQYLVMIDHQKLFKNVLFIFFILAIVFLYWRVGIRGEYITSFKKRAYANIFPYNPNWFSCLSCFLFVYFCKVLKTDKIRFFLLALLLVELYLLQTRFSFLLACFILPMFVFKKRFSIIFFIIIISGILFVLIQSTANNKVVNVLQSNVFKTFINDYIRCTSTGSFISEKFGCKSLRPLEYYSNKESHNYFVTFFREYNFFEKCIFLTVFCMTFTPFSILFLIYGLTITAPLYFFVAFTFCIYKTRKY